MFFLAVVSTFLLVLQYLNVLIVSSCLTGCVRNVTLRPATVVCLQRIDWADKSLDDLTDTNKKAIIILDDYCDLKAE